MNTPQEASQDTGEISLPVMIHVRFSPDGSVVEIGERPISLQPQIWFNRLSAMAGTNYQALSGGRGLFRLPRAEVDAIKSAALN